MVNYEIMLSVWTSSLLYAKKNQYSENVSEYFAFWMV